MKRNILIIFILVAATLFLSGCGENYPRICIYEKWNRDPITIDIGNLAKYDGFDMENVENGKDLILHFREIEAEE